MEILQGYTYHIKESYFEFAQDDNLMQNKEQGSYRSTLYYIKDENKGIILFIFINNIFFDI